MKKLIQNTKIVVYKALRQKMKRPHQRVVEFMKSNPKTKIWDIEFEGKYLGDACFRNDHDLANPKSKLAILFISSTGQCGLRPGAWYVMVNNRLFKRVTYGDIGKKGTRSGLVTTRDGNVIMYLSPIKISKEDKSKMMGYIYGELNV